MSNYKYTLEPYAGKNTRHDCPSCEHKKSFTKYINTETGEYLNDAVGACDRLINCGYHYKPKDYFRDNKHLQVSNRSAIRKSKIKHEPRKTKPISLVAHELVSETLRNYEQNIFVQFLINHFGYSVAYKLVKHFLIGTAKKGRVIFWQIDDQCRVRAGKIMTYQNNGKRDKNQKPTWVHTELRLKDYTLNQCLFGLHQLIEADPFKPVSIVESEKTAIIATHFFPEYVWLSCGGIFNLSNKTCRALENRKVVLFPDLGAYEKWKGEAKELGFLVSDFLEKRATEEEKKKGLDLADYLLKMPIDKQFGNVLNQYGYPTIWDN